MDINDDYHLYRAQERVRATNIVVFVEKNNVEIIRDIIF